MASTPDLQQLKQQLWQRTFHNTDIQYADHYYRIISDKLNAMILRIGLQRAALHWHTIRNFFSDRGTPQPATLDLFATYAANSQQLITYHQFQNGDFAPLTLRPTLLSGGPGKWRIKVTLEVPVILELEHLPGTEWTQEE